MSTRGQQTKIHILGKVLDLDRSAVHGFCVQWYGADPSTKALSTAQASDMIQRFEAMIQDDPQISEKAQRSKIYKLGYLLDWKSDSIRSFVKRQTQGRVRDVNHLTFQEASKVIVGMERIIRSDGKGHLLETKEGKSKK